MCWVERFGSLLIYKGTSGVGGWAILYTLRNKRTCTFTLIQYFRSIRSEIRSIITVSLVRGLCTDWLEL